MLLMQQQELGVVSDLFPIGNNITGAFSFQKVNPSYTGYCCQIKRDSDSSTLDISFVSGVVDTASISTFCSGTTGRIQIWYNQDGSANHLKGIDARPLPIIYASGSVVTRNGNVAIDMKSSNMIFNGYLVSINIGSTFSVIYDELSGATPHCLPLGTRTPAIVIGFMTNGSGDDPTIGAWSDDAYYKNGTEIVSATRNDLFDGFVIDDTVLATVETSTNYVQRAINYNHTSNSSNMFLSELIVTDGLPWDKSFVENNIMSRYSI